MDQLVPPESPLRRVPVTVEKKTILYLDGVRYSIEIAELTFKRLARTLSSFTEPTADGLQVSQPIIEAMSDAWMFIDSVHRLREIIQQTPKIRQKDPQLQLFLRTTASVEELRHFIQHLRSGIPSFVERNMPLWGTLSWGESGFEDGRLVNHIVVPGTYYNGVWATGVTIDTQNGCFCERILLQAGNLRVDLADVFDRVVALSTWYTAWFVSMFADEPRHGADAHLVFVAKPIRRPLSTVTSGIADTLEVEREKSDPLVDPDAVGQTQQHGIGSASPLVSDPRPATVADVPALQSLITRSGIELSAGFYAPEQAAAITEHVFGVDSQLIADGTYHVLEADGAIVACGGWSRRRTLFGGDQTKTGPDPLLDLAADPARIRAFFVDPAFARRGLGRRLLDHCTAETARAGFRALELASTLPGEPLYLACGFEVVERFEIALPGDIRVPLVRMRKVLG